MLAFGGAFGVARALRDDAPPAEAPAALERVDLSAAPVAGGGADAAAKVPGLRPRAKRKPSESPRCPAAAAAGETGGSTDGPTGTGGTGTETGTGTGDGTGGSGTAPATPTTAKTEARPAGSTAARPAARRGG